jgi:hypothetical protein
MSNDTAPGAILTMNEEPIHVPSGPLTDGSKKRIEDAVGLNVPDGAHLAVLALLDKDGNAKPEGKFGLAWKVDKHWQLATEVSKTWDGPVHGFVGIVGVF